MGGAHPLIRRSIHRLGSQMVRHQGEHIEPSRHRPRSSTTTTRVRCHAEVDGPPHNNTDAQFRALPIGKNRLLEPALRRIPERRSRRLAGVPAGVDQLC
jgi:hypothetical protein